MKYEIIDHTADFGIRVFADSEMRLYLVNVKQEIGHGGRVDALTPRSIKARVNLEPYDAVRHRVLSEIKAVTYHGIDVGRRNDRWEARIIFDV